MTTDDRTTRSHGELLELRRRHYGFNLSLSYRHPLQIVRGEGAHLVAADGRRYVDLVNNVCHVGHCHQAVVDAASRQMAILNTNTRYLHPNLVDYALRLSATFPDPLSVCFFTNSGTEANDLAMRLVRAHTGSRDVVVLDHAYHGNSPTQVALSAYKAEGAGGDGLASWAHKVPLPDLYRAGPDAGAASLRAIDEAIVAVRSAGRPVGGFFAESISGCGGQVPLAPGYLEAAYERTRAAGGLCLADEVQCGLGRVGDHWWAFEEHGVVPDIVTLGKPIGNGHPLGAVVTTPEVAASFDNGMEYFNTFGGNPVSCAVGLAVLDVMESEALRSHALSVGNAMLDALSAVRGRHALIGDVRGRGLFLGVELVRDRDTLEPAGDEATAVVEAMKDRGYLLSTDGPFHNVIKIKPPLVLTRDDALGMVEALDAVLTESVDQA